MAEETVNNGRAVSYFKPDRQPDPEAKRKGWLKKKVGRELLRNILEMDFKGMGPEFKEKLATYYGLDPEEITNEGALVLSQLITAIQKGDTFAFNAIMDRAYGKPKELRESAANNNPQFTVEISSGSNGDQPTIATSEDEVGAVGGTTEIL